MGKLLEIEATPFVKWVGGKTQLLNDIEMRLPEDLKNGTIKKYVEPFVGSGAVLLYVLQKYGVKEAIISDINLELINVYKVIKYDVYSLIHKLSFYQSSYLPMLDEERKAFYYEVRENFNNSGTLPVQENKYCISRAAQFIFLNRTCFNGLFRVNKSGKYNVPMGRYVNPTICNEENLLSVSRLLDRVKIIYGDYQSSKEYIDSQSFVYFDPPYRPLTTTSSFTSYTKYDFKDEDQITLANYYKEMHQKGAKLMMSNSDPRNSNPDDAFFDKLFKEFKVHRIKARRNINSNGEKRGEISELLILNY